MKKIDAKTWRKKPLYKLLQARLTGLLLADGLLDVHTLAEKLGYSHEAVYKWLRAGKLSRKSARALLKLSRGKINESDLIPFLLVN